jgi:hypothetical protein
MTNKLATSLLAAAVLLALAAPAVLAGDPDMLQDICVADYKSLKGRKCHHRSSSTTCTS